MTREAPTRRGPGPGIEQAHADLLRIAQDRVALASELGRRPPARATRHSAVLILFGVLEPADFAPNAPADVDLLLTRRSDSLRHHPGQVAFPGGGIDDGESAVAAALREAGEEVGVAADGVEVLGALPEVPVAVSGNVVTPVLGWWRRPSPLVVDETETAQAFRVPVSQLLTPAHRGSVSVGRPGGGQWRTPAFAVPTTAGRQVVWGFTAFVLESLFAQLGWDVPWDREREIELPGRP